MSDDDNVLTEGPFKGKRIVFVSDERINRHGDRVDEFMRKVLPEFRAYYLTDESTLSHFSFGHDDRPKRHVVLSRIKKHYGFEPLDGIHATIADVLDRIWPQG